MFSSLLIFLAIFPAKPSLDYTRPSFCSKRDTDFKEYRYNEIAVCNRNVSTELKDVVYNNYKIPEDVRSEFTIDHFVPLSLGGSNRIENLWPQHKSISTASYETTVYSELISGVITYQEALNKIFDRKLK